MFFIANKILLNKLNLSYIFEILDWALCVATLALCCLSLLHVHSSAEIGYLAQVHPAVGKNYVSRQHHLKKSIFLDQRSVKLFPVLVIMKTHRMKDLTALRILYQLQIVKKKLVELRGIFRNAAIFQSVDIKNESEEQSSDTNTAEEDDIFTGNIFWKRVLHYICLRKLILIISL